MLPSTGVFRSGVELIVPSCNASESVFCVHKELFGSHRSLGTTGHSSQLAEIHWVIERHVLAVTDQRP